MKRRNTAPLETILGDARGSERFRRFCEACVIHVKGPKGGKPFIPADWQWEGVIKPLLDTLRPDGTRLFRNGYVSFARKSGKSTLSAVLALYFLFCDEEFGAEVYCAASSREQAGLIFGIAAAMCEASPVLKKLAKIGHFQKFIRVCSTNSFLRCLSAEAPHLHGLNSSFVVLDEISEQPNADLFDVLATSMGARRQPLMLAIGTAGDDVHSVAYKLYQHAKSLTAGTIQDSSFFAYVRELPEGADWRDESLWSIPNPSLDDFRSRDELREMCQRAILVPSQQTAFERFYMNRWVKAESRWLSLLDWDACDLANWTSPSLTEGPASRLGESYEGKMAFAGLDYGSSRDLSALVLAIPLGDGPVFLLPKFWMPTAHLDERERQDRVPYRRWIQQGLITAVDGPTVEVAIIEDALIELREKFDLREIAYDPWNLRDLGQRLLNQGFKMVEFSQSMASYTQPTKRFESAVVNHTLRHDGNEVLRWMIECCTVRQDTNGNIKPAKPDRLKDARRIDGVVAAIMALDRLNVNSTQPDLEEILKRGPITFQL